MSSSWAHEIFFLIVCWGSLAAICGLFLHFDGKPVPHWALDLSLHSVVSILSTAIEGSIACVVYSSTYQLLYLWNRQRRLLHDVEIFSKAARSIRGALPIIKLQKFSGVASHFAIAYMMSKAISTNVQQAISIRPKLVPFGVGTVPIATRVSRQLSSSSSISNLDNQMVATMWNGFLSTESDLPRIPAVCDGANECHWENYTTIAVRHRCEDINDLVIPCGEGFNCSHRLPTTGGALTVGPGQAYTSMAYLFADFMTDIPWYLAAWIALAIPEDARNQTIAARRCKLFFTVDKYSSSMINGSFQEYSIAEPWHNTTFVSSNNSEWIMNPNGSDTNFSASPGPQLSASSVSF